MKFTTDEFFAGYVGGACGVLVGHPLDTIKTVQQYTNKPISATCYDIIVRNHGLHGFYRGLFFPLICQGFMNSIIFGVSNNVQRHLENQCGTEEQLQHLHAHHVFFSGCAAGFLSTFIGCPVELIKVRQQTRHCLTTNSIACMRTIWRNEGFRGYYRGFDAMLCRDILPFGVYMLVYDQFFQICDNLEWANEKKKLYKSLDDNHQSLDRYYRILGTVSGAIAGTTSWIISLPFDVLKTLLQLDMDKPKYHGLIHCAKTVVDKQGWRRLFVGGWILVIRSFPVNAATFLGYTYCIEKTKAPNYDRK